MGNVLILGEHADGKLKKSALSTITFAKEVAGHMGGDVHMLLLGAGLEPVADQVKSAGCKVIHLVEHDGFARYDPDTWAPVVQEVAKEIGATMIAGAASTTTKDLLPKVTALLDAAMISDTMAVIDAKTYKRPMWAGNAIATVEVSSDTIVASVRATEFDAAPTDGEAAEYRKWELSPATDCHACFVKFDAVANERPDLTEAAVVVSGGRGVKGEDGVKIIEGLADQLGAAVGWTRAVVDAGWAPNDLQVGQTGKIVAPDLYFAIGLSGAIQHLAGMKGSKTIVAINKDEEAPIFTVADYGLAGDLFKAVPELMEEIKKQKS